jgi:hypothetical protein
MNLSKIALDFSQNSVLELNLLYEQSLEDKHLKLLVLAYLRLASNFKKMKYWKKSEQFLGMGSCIGVW